MTKLGIYVQVPFCQTKCTYCNFHTGVVASRRFAPYVEAVCGEIRGHRELLKAAGVDWPEGLGRPLRRTAPLQRNDTGGGGQTACFGRRALHRENLGCGHGLHWGRDAEPA